jgi:hypothetical protein
MTDSAKRLVKTFPGKGGILTRVVSLSNESLSHSKSEYRRLTVLFLSLNAGIFVYDYLMEGYIAYDLIIHVLDISHFNGARINYGYF